MTRKRPKQDCCLSPPVPPPNPDEERDLKEFCSSVHYEEMSFESWCQKPNKLDLQIPIFLTRDQLSASFRTVVKFTRTIRTSSAHGHQEKREKIEREVVLGPDIDVCKAIKLQGLGDAIDDNTGDLWIIIQLKD